MEKYSLNIFSHRQRYLSGVCSLDVTAGFSQEVLFRSGFFLTLYSSSKHSTTTPYSGYLEAVLGSSKCWLPSPSSTWPMLTSALTFSSLTMTRDSGRYKLFTSVVSLSALSRGDRLTMNTTNFQRFELLVASSSLIYFLFSISPTP